MTLRKYSHWFLFVGLYFLPLLLEPSALAISNSQVRLLLEQSLASPVVREGGVQFVLVNILLCGVAIVCLDWLACRLARLSGISSVLSKVGCVLFGWALLLSANAWLFPHSNYSVVFSVLNSETLGKVLFGVFIALVLVACIIGNEWRHFTHLAVAVVGGGFALGLWSLADSASSKSPHERNVIIIGVDSLSGHVFEHDLESLPSLAEATAHATHYTRAYTPLGRTFPAWVSLLSGRPPAENGAFFNLRNMEHVGKNDLVTTSLHNVGYRTVFAIDERRFSNIDESFGFDRVVGPKVGVLDFLLQVPSDTPLSNLLLQTRLGRYLLPYSYINSAAYPNYSANGFVDSVVDAVGVDKPLFLAVHFESAHFPFKSRHARVHLQRDNPFLAKHLEALTVVDYQVGQLMAGLRKRGLLENALVVVLSDHGEGLGDVEVKINLDGQSMPVTGYGHGANILSDRQTRIALAATIYTDGKPEANAGSIAEQVSLLDIRRAIEGYVRTGEFKVQPTEACLMVETGIRLDTTSDYRVINEASVVQQAASYYEVDKQGRLRLREEVLPALLATKDIGLRCLDRITWYDAASQHILSASLDERGIPAQQQLPPEDDVAKIVAYRHRYVH